MQQEYANLKKADKFFDKFFGYCSAAEVKEVGGGADRFRKLHLQEGAPLKALHYSC